MQICPRLDVDIFKCDIKAWSRFTAGEIDDPISRCCTGEIVEMDVGPPAIQFSQVVSHCEGDSQEPAGVFV